MLVQVMAVAAAVAVAAVGVAAAAAVVAAIDRSLCHSTTLRLKKAP